MQATPGLGSEIGRALSQLETERTDADYGEGEITVEGASAAIAKAQRVVDAVEHALAAGLWSEPPV